MLSPLSGVLGDCKGRGSELADVNHLIKLSRVLKEDVNTSINNLNDCEQKDFGYNARSYLRSYASWVEGSLHIYKNTIANIEYKWMLDLPTQYQLYLHEYDFKIKGSGEIIALEKKLKTKENLKAFFVVMAKLFDGFSVEFDKGGWEDVLFFYAIRDKMMHPNNVKNLEVSKEDIEKCDSGRQWLEQSFEHLRDKIIERLDHEESCA